MPYAVGMAPADPDAAGLTAGAVARRLGVAVTTLRTWDRRYGIGPHGHESGRHRRYGPEDVARLQLMRQLTADGVPPAEAAAWIRDRPDAVIAPTGARPASEPPPRTRDGGGHAIPVGDAGPAARGLARAAVRLDATAMDRLLGRAVTERGVVAAWEEMIAPVLIGVGQRHAATRQLVDVEHLLSRCVSAALGRVPAVDGRVGVLLACADDEQHSLPLEALAASLAERGIGTRQLGARVPPQALAEAIRRVGPDVVVLWAATAETGAPGQVVAVREARPRPKLIVAAGPGWPREALPDDVATPETLADAVRLIAGG